MKKKIFVLSTLLLAPIISSVTFDNPSSFENISNVAAESQTFEKNNFVSIENFLYSSKGLQLEFTFDVPSTTKVNTFNFMSNWARLTANLKMTFYANGTVSCEAGRVFKRGDSYFYQIMMSELSNLLNTSAGEVASGHETLNMLYNKDANVRINITNATVIDTTINLGANACIRDSEKPGLKFKAYLPSIDQSVQYGMVIVPNYYIAKMTGNYIENLRANSKSFVDLKCEPAALSASDDLYATYGSGYFIQGSLTNILPQNYQLPFTAIPYEKTNAGEYRYGNFIKQGKATFYDTILTQIDNGNVSSMASNTKDYLNTVLSYCENHTVKERTEIVQAYFASNTEQILKDDPMPSNPVLSASIESAKSEKETIQLILRTNSSNDLRYYINSEPFVNSQNSNIKIPAKNVTFYKELYQNVATNWAANKYYRDHDYMHGAIETSRLGYFPDALLPFDLAIDSGENVINNVNGQNNGINIKIEVPDNIPSGTYNSKIIVRIVGEGTIVLPITLNVHNFDIKKNNSKYLIFVSPGQIEYVYGNDNTSRTGNFYKSAYELMADHGVSGQLPEVCWQVSDVDKWVKEAKKATLDNRINAFNLPTLSEDSGNIDLTVKATVQGLGQVSIPYSRTTLVGKDYLSSGNVQLPGYETLFKKMVEASTNECNLFEKAIVYFPQADEPGSNNDIHLQNIFAQNVIKTSAEIVSNLNIFSGKEKVKQSLLKLPYIVTSYPRGLMNGSTYTYTYQEYKSGKYVTKTEYRNLISIDSITCNSDKCAEAYITSDVSCVKDWSLKGYCPTYDSFEKWDYIYSYGKNETIVKGVEATESLCKSDSHYAGYYEVMNALNDPNYTMWWYGCCQPISPFPNNLVNNKYIRSRANKWLQFKFGVQGELYYMCNRASSITGNETDPGEHEYGTHYAVEATEANKKISYEDEILNGGCTYNGGYGDGQYIYPVHNKYKDIDSNVYWLSSMRLENLAESNDDYNYLYLANELISKLSGSAKTQAQNTLMSAINSIVGQSGPYANTTNHDKIVAAKQAVATLIDNLIG